MFNSKAGLGDVVEKAEERRAQSTSRNVGQDCAFATFADSAMTMQMIGCSVKGGGMCICFAILEFLCST